MDRWADRKVERSSPTLTKGTHYLHAQGVIIHHHSFIPVILNECLLLYTNHNLWVKDESTEELGCIAQIAS